MSSIQKVLESLQPYVIGIRYVDTMAVIDVIFKEGWVVPDSDKVKKAKGDEGLNYYMVFSDIEGVGIDDLLDYVSSTINFNLDREKKHELLKFKVKELQEIFKKNSLTKLTKLKFMFGEEELIPNLTDMDYNEEDVTETPVVIEVKKEEITPAQYVDENGKAEPLTEEQLEMIEEEKRAQRFKQVQETTKKKSDVKNLVTKKIELPPKKFTQPVIGNSEPDCNCGETEACEKCVEYKDL